MIGKRNRHKMKDRKLRIELDGLDGDEELAPTKRKRVEPTLRRQALTQVVGRPSYEAHAILMKETLMD